MGGGWAGEDALGEGDGPLGEGAGDEWLGDGAGDEWLGDGAGEDALGEGAGDDTPGGGVRAACGRLVAVLAPGDAESDVPAGLMTSYRYRLYCRMSPMSFAP